MKLPASIIIKYGKIGVIAVMIVILGILGWFLNSYVYVPLTQAVALAELKTYVSLVSVNKTGLDKLVAKITRDREPSPLDWNKIRNPFENPVPKNNEIATPPVNEIIPKQ